MPNKFGKLVRKKRQQKNYTLRGFAKEIGISASCLSLVETKGGSLGVDKMKKLTQLLGINLDEGLALLGKIAPDLKEIIIEKPKERAAKIRNFRKPRRT